MRSCSSARSVADLLRAVGLRMLRVIAQRARHLIMYSAACVLLKFPSSLSGVIVSLV
jgi:hypothetical protein